MLLRLIEEDPQTHIIHLFPVLRPYRSAGTDAIDQSDTIGGLNKNKHPLKTENQICYCHKI